MIIDNRSLAMLALAGSLLASACTGNASANQHAEPVACDELETGTADTALMLLVDGATPAVDRLTDQLAGNPDAVFSSENVDLGTQAGIVTIATYDDTGQVIMLGEFNLAGVGSESVRRTADARRQAECLEDTLAGLPEPENGHLLRALPTALSILEPLAEQSVIVAAGLGRADGDGFDVDQTDLSTPDARSHVLDQLQATSFIPDFASSGAGLIFLAPGAGVESGIVANHIAAFATEFCDRTNATLCTSEETLP